jgi:UDP-N-acetylmuramoyl-tripeptide--D-alanyl-D-alanine ligase
LAEGLTWQDIGAGLRQGHTQLRLVAVHTETGALLLDDTYNASPESTLAALNLLNDLEGRKVAVLGDMLELGPYETQGHEMVGVRAAEIAQELVLVGDRAEIIGQAARHSGLSPSMIHWFKTTDEASDYLRQSLAEKDVVLVKGSRGMRMDRIVAALEVTQ